MSLTSIPFLLFALAVVSAYFIVPKKAQWIVVLAANIVFYCWSGPRYIVYIVVAALIGWFLALQLEKVNNEGTKQTAACSSPEELKQVRLQIKSRKKRVCTAAIIGVLGIWIVLKYSNFMIGNVNAVLGLFRSASRVPNVSWVLPIGISFYSFHIVGYLVDVYRKKYPAERNFLKFFTFVSYFPHIIEGPFSRFDGLGTQILAEHSFSYDRLCQGCARILWGFSKKLLVADKLGGSVNEILANYSAYTGTHVVFAFLAYAIQLYADFSGYMDIVCGISHILGIELLENFRQPYFAKTVDEYWRRWHITLGQWFKDYMFMPVSMGPSAQKLGRSARKKWGARMGRLVPGYCALFFVWTCTGLWHGANWTYLIWGYLNLLVIMSTMQLGVFYDNLKAKLHIRSDHWLWQFFCIVRTFCLVSFFRFFSISPSVGTAVRMIGFAIRRFSVGALIRPWRLLVTATHTEIVVIGCGFLVMLAVDILNEKGWWEKLKSSCPFPVRDIIYVALIMALILFAGGENDLVGGFMYAQF